MANEGTVTCILRMVKGGTDEKLDIGPLSFDIAGTQYHKGRQSVGITEEALSIGDAAYGGYLILVNRDPLNFVEWYTGTGGTITGKMLAGDVAVFRTQTTADLFLIADNAICDVEVFVLDL